MSESQFASSPSSPSGVPKLRCGRDWRKWFVFIMGAAASLKVAGLVDPSGEPTPYDSFPGLNQPSSGEILREIQKLRGEGGEATAFSAPPKNLIAHIVDDGGRDKTKTGLNPPRPSEEYEKARQRLDARHQEWILLYQEHRSGLKEMDMLIFRSVDPILYRAACLRTGRADPSTREILRALRSSIAPPDTTIRLDVEVDYLRVLERAHLGNQKPTDWIRDWRRVYEEAEMYNLYEVMGPRAQVRFIDAVAARFSPDWADYYLNEFFNATDYDKGLEMTVGQLGSLFEVHVLTELQNETKARLQDVIQEPFPFASSAKGQQPRAPSVTKKRRNQRNKQHRFGEAKA